MGRWSFLTKLLAWLWIHTACDLHSLRTGFAGWLEDPQVGSECVPFQLFALLYWIIGIESMEVRLHLFLQQICSFSPCFIASVTVGHWKSGTGVFIVFISLFLLRFWQWNHSRPHGLCVFKDIHTYRWQLRVPGWQHPCPGADGPLCSCSHAWLWSPRKDQCFLGSNECSSGK